MSGSLEATLRVIGSFDPSVSGFIIAATWFVLQISKFGFILKCRFFSGVGTGLRESLTRMVDRMPWLINHQLVTLRWLTHTKSKWPNGVLVLIGTAYGTAETQPVKRSEPSHHLSSETHEMCLYSTTHISFIHLLSIFYFYVHFYSARFFCCSYVKDDLKHAVLVKGALHQTELRRCPFEDMVLSICNWKSVFTRSLCL